MVNRVQVIAQDNVARGRISSNLFRFTPQTRKHQECFLGCSVLMVEIAAQDRNLQLNLDYRLNYPDDVIFQSLLSP